MTSSGNIENISWIFDKKTEETHVVIEYEHVGESRPGSKSVIINMQVTGDFAHHAIEDAMLGLNELAKAKGIGHKMILDEIDKNE